MTPEALTCLIAGGESLDVEFKGEEQVPLSDRDLADRGLLDHSAQVIPDARGQDLDLLEFSDRAAASASGAVAATTP
ncbi:hypothetical protein [Limnochorda pilosa]|uniref:Uncharacterized protein n=1 Tax=Limnochorda pilosa TaxID=1555112 RepID=A0A0K2SM66_LIMPI|nr:hypothetical protein [Limnochorda pilosa]BAS28208.1 hypothetical protein LIP_2367 [Limnochorda pilosa]